jgi:tripartite-type tricarboxylate transporter receptor subunit TctC
VKAIVPVAFAVGLALLASAAPAQEYPTKPVRVIVPVPPGGANDTLMFPTTQAVMPYVTAGKLRALAVTGASRSALAPDLPTMAQAGLPGVEVGSWFAVLAPGGTPREVVAKLDGEVRKVLQAPEVGDRLRALGYESFYMPPEPLASYIRADLAKWTKVIRQAGIRAE